MPEKCPAPVRRLAWDSRFWGFPVAEYRPERFSRRKIHQVLTWCQQRKVRCLYLFLPACNLAQHQGWLRQNRIHRVEERILLGRRLAHPSLSSMFPSGWASLSKIQTPKDADLKFLERAAFRMHRNTRFFKDRGFSARKAGLLYSLWIGKDFKKKHVLVALAGGNNRTIRGYVSFEKLDAKVGRIGLLAVLPPFQGKGWGKQLTLAALQWLQQASCTRAFVTTQAENQAALRLYRSAGFRQYRTYVCFHRWFV
jgi:ribosomal protein S18 acetylase RimI-like enzyme